MKSLLHRVFLFLVCLPMSASCVLEVDALRQRQEALTARLELLEAHSRSGWRQALCSRDSRLLLKAVERECENGTCQTENPPSDVIIAQVCSLDPRRRERFLEILAEQEREVFYLYSNSKSLSEESRKKLISLVMGIPPLPTTRFLVVTRPWDREPEKEKHLLAERRGRVVQNAILEILSQHQNGESSPADAKTLEKTMSQLRRQRTLLWTYAFPLRSGMKTRPAGPHSQPAPGKAFESWGSSTNTDAPPDDERGIWVFRLDC